MVQGGRRNSIAVSNFWKNKLKGKRFFLTAIKEEKDSELLFELRQRTYPEKKPFEDDPMFLVYFNIDKELPLIGPGS